MLKARMMKMKKGTRTKMMSDGVARCKKERGEIMDGQSNLEKP
jgi:hypothetical protein